MPELPEVETVKLALIPALQGRTVLSAFVGRKDLRWPLPENLAERLTGLQFTRLARRGKYVMMMLDNGEVLCFILACRARYESMKTSQRLANMIISCWKWHRQMFRVVHPMLC